MSVADAAHQTQLSQPSEREFSATRHVDAPRDLVWKAHTEPEHIRQWLLGPDGWTMTVCEVDLRPGGAWRWEWRSDDGRSVEMDGEYEEIREPELIINTERWGGSWPETVNTLVLIEESGGTHLTLSTQYPSEADRDRATATGMADGLITSYNRLERYLQTLGG